MTTHTNTLITTDTHCISCNYSLRGLDRSALCPECATPARQSFPPLPFEQSPPHHLRTLAAGLHRLETSLHIFVVSGVILLLAFAVGAFLLLVQHSTKWRTIQLLFIPVSIATFLAAFLFIFSVAGITQPTSTDAWLPPRAARAEKTRSFLRAMLALLTVAIFILTSLTIAWLVFDSETLVPAVDAAFIAAGILAVIIIFNTAAYLREITLRIPDHTLAKRILTTARIATSAASLALLAAILTNPLPRVPPSVSVPLQSTAWTTLALSLLATAVAVLLLARHLRTLRRHTLRALQANNPPSTP